MSVKELKLTNVFHMYEQSTSGEREQDREGLRESMYYTQMYKEIRFYPF